MIFSGFVSKARRCWTAKAINNTPETTKRAIMDPEFQSYTVPPKLMPRTRVMIAPIESSVPR